MGVNELPRLARGADTQVGVPSQPPPRTTRPGAGGRRAPEAAPGPEHPPRDYLRAKELERLLAAAREGRQGARNRAMLLTAYRHALRATEACRLKVSDVDLAAGEIYCRRLKGSVSNIHPLAEDELAVLKAFLQCRAINGGDRLFVSERGGPMSRYGFWHIVRAAGARAGLGRRIHPHMLKHAAGYYLANKGLDVRLIQEYMGHVQIMNTIRYTRADASRFAGIWA